MTTDEPTQATPQGHEIPVPLREDVFADLRKAARPARPGPEEEPSDDGRALGGPEEQQ